RAILAGCGLARCRLWVFSDRNRCRACDCGWPSGNWKAAGPDHCPSVSPARVVFSLVLCFAHFDPKMVGRLGDHSWAGPFLGDSNSAPAGAGKGERSPLRRPWSFVIVAFVMFMIAYYG